MTTHYVYAHYRVSDGSIFYIGKGSGKRAWIKANRSLYWKRVVQKNGYSVRILCYCTDEPDALDIECLLISLVGRADIGSGCLVNFTDGGEGTSNRVVPITTRMAVAKSNKERERSEIQASVVKNRYLGKKGSLHNRSIAVKCVNSGVVYGSKAEAERILGLGGGSVSWSMKHQKPIFGMHFEAGA